MGSTIITCPPIDRHSTKRSDEHIVFIDDNAIHVSPKEYLLLVPLLDHPQHEASDEQLARAIFSCQTDKSMRETLKRHIDNIRSKLRPYGVGVSRVVMSGYNMVALKELHD